METHETAFLWHYKTAIVLKQSNHTKCLEHTSEDCDRIRTLNLNLSTLQFFCIRTTPSPNKQKWIFWGKFMYYVVTISEKSSNSNATPGLTLVPELEQSASGHVQLVHKWQKWTYFGGCILFTLNINIAMHFSKLNTRYMEPFKDFSPLLSLCKKKSISMVEQNTQD